MTEKKTKLENDDSRYLDLERPRGVECPEAKSGQIISGESSPASSFADQEN